ncbi:hypothetical protein LX32DRAFT_412074 [Colletotrichum zoysiae]|uniref:Uncharacterized protein n=1 Tax=Colletotrichum zoysiae TaxID=1216348 RepID=A0AAD9HH07_9PEZI|nr:hypothetical protein LX32DRAFT_412074 [Colletotrichum zoysiae]
MKVFSFLTLLCATSVNAGYLCACKYRVPEVIHTEITQRVCAKIPNARLDGTSCNIGNNKDLVTRFNRGCVSRSRASFGPNVALGRCKFIE